MSPKKVLSIIDGLKSYSILFLISKAIENPKKALDYFFRTGNDRWTQSIFSNQAEYHKYLLELDSGYIDSLLFQLRDAFADIAGKTSRGNSFVPGQMKTNQAREIYALVRKVKPQIIVETGVCNGFSTAVILKSLSLNGEGKLYSIDYPEYTDNGLNEKLASEAGEFWQGKGGAVVPSGRGSGWLVPQDLRHYWNLSLGKSEDKLPLLLTQLDKIDIFIHDSEHSLENQLFEFRLAFKHLKTNGILLASDITWSPAFDVFLNEVRGQSKHFFIDHNLALVIKL